MTGAIRSWSIVDCFLLPAGAKCLRHRGEPIIVRKTFDLSGLLGVAICPGYVWWMVMWLVLGLLLFHLLRNLPRRSSFLKHRRVSNFLTILKSIESTQNTSWQSQNITLLRFSCLDGRHKEYKNCLNLSFWEDFVEGRVINCFQGALSPLTVFTLSTEPLKDFLRRFMGVSWESCLVRGRLYLLMSKHTPDSSRSGWTEVINDRKQGALTTFISAAVQSPNTKNLQSRVQVWVDTAIHHTPVCTLLTHPCALIDTLKVVQGLGP